MDSITDPKILAIMSKLDDKPTAPKQQDPALVGAGDPNRPTRPPLTLEEFIKAERLVGFEFLSFIDSNLGIMSSNCHCFTVNLFRQD